MILNTVLKCMVFFICRRDCVKVGKMRYRVMFLENPCVSDDEGNIVDTWNPVCTVWADITPVSGREYLGSQQDTSEVTSRIYIRYHPGINSKMRIVADGNRCFEIISVLGDRRSGMLTIMPKMIMVHTMER